MPPLLRALLGLVAILVACPAHDRREPAHAPGDAGSASLAPRAPDDTVAPSEVALPTAPATAAPEPVVVSATRCDVGQGTGGASAYRLVDAFPALPDLAQPLDLRPAGERLWVIERQGRVLSFDPRDARAFETVLDLRERVYTVFECGLLGLAIDPRWPAERAFYTHHNERRAGVTQSFITRWRLRDGGPPVEERLLALVQPWDNHNGGALAFGPDGHLYIGFGDGGSANDPRNVGQDTQSLLGKILRLDVATRGTPERPYGIPADNPFAAGGGRPEIYAWGLRNPWRMSFDRLTRELWVGDVGQDAREEIDVVERGHNYGWRVMEGTLCRPGGPRECDRSGLTLPVLEYARKHGRSVTGGYVYRGERLPALVGRYVYADFSSRALWAWRRGDPPPAAPLLTTPAMIAAFGEGADGELYALGIDTGRIYRLELDPAGVARRPPDKLSATGCFSALGPLAPGPGVMGYDLALPFWSDGAKKQRWLWMPPGGRVTPAPEGASAPWRFPEATVFMKHFATPRGRPETRFLVQQADGVRGFTYRWDEDGRDATLLDDGLVADGWVYPSPAECVTCHVGRGPLGLTTPQLGRQPEAWAAAGLVDGAVPTTPALHPPLDDEAVPVEARARAWLHVNCAYCHAGPTGPSGTTLDLRVDTPLAAMSACDVPPQRNDLGLSGARRITPGTRATSLVHARLTRRDALGMPPLATLLVDPVGSELVGRWIDGLAACP